MTTACRLPSPPHKRKAHRPLPADPRVRFLQSLVLVKGRPEPEAKEDALAALRADNPGWVTSPDGYVLVDSGGAILWCNHQRASSHRGGAFFFGRSCVGHSLQHYSFIRSAFLISISVDFNLEKLSFPPLFMKARSIGFGRWAFFAWSAEVIKRFQKS